MLIDRHVCIWFYSVSRRMILYRVGATSSCFLSPNVCHRFSGCSIHIGFRGQLTCVEKKHKTFRILSWPCYLHRAAAKMKWQKKKCRSQPWRSEPQQNTMLRRLVFIQVFYREFNVINAVNRSFFFKCSASIEYMMQSTHFLSHLICHFVMPCHASRNWRWNTACPSRDLAFFTTSSRASSLRMRRAPVSAVSAWWFVFLTELHHPSCSDLSFWTFSQDGSNATCDYPENPAARNLAFALEIHRLQGDLKGYSRAISILSQSQEWLEFEDVVVSISCSIAANGYQISQRFMAKSHEGLRCVHCGAPVEDLFYRIGQDIRLRQCSCGKVADHHIEFEILLVFIEMQLLRPEVYRHVLFNRFSPTILSREAGRFLLLCLILDTYTRWSQFKSTDSKSGISHWLQDSEHADWAVLGVTILETGTYLLSVSVVALLGSSTHSVFSKRSHLRVWEAILVSSFGKVYKLIALVWGGSNGGQAMVIALAIFVAASNIMAVETVLDSNVRSAAIAVVLASTLRLGVASCFMPLLIPWWIQS